MNEEVKNLINSHDDLKQHILNKIDEVRNLIETEQYGKLAVLTVLDDCNNGKCCCNNKEEYYVNFAIGTSYNKQKLVDAIDTLIEYQEQIEELKCAEEIHKLLNL